MRQPWEQAIEVERQFKHRSYPLSLAHPLSSRHAEFSTQSYHDRMKGRGVLSLLRGKLSLRTSKQIDLSTINYVAADHCRFSKGDDAARALGHDHQHLNAAWSRGAPHTLFKLSRIGARNAALAEVNDHRIAASSCAAS